MLPKLARWIVGFSCDVSSCRSYSVKAGITDLLARKGRAPPPTAVYTHLQSSATPLTLSQAVASQQLRSHLNTPRSILALNLKSLEPQPIPFRLKRPMSPAQHDLGSTPGTQCVAQTPPVWYPGICDAAASPRCRTWAPHMAPSWAACA